MNSKKGFTLIELLAVIVILAVLVLLAMPAVTSIMESSSKNTFKNEILGVVKTMENAYTEKWGNGDIVSTFDDDTKIHTVTKDDKTYSYLCMSLKQLYEEQYIKKNLGDNYGGYIQMYVGDTDTYTYINTTNGTYYMQGDYGALSASTYVPSKSNNGKEATTCPSDENDLDTPGTGGSTGGESGSGGNTGGESGSGGESGGETPTETSKLAVDVIKALVAGEDDTTTEEIGETGLAYDQAEHEEDGTKVKDNNLRYIGKKPDNYVYFNCSTTNEEEMNDTTCEKWRIIGVMNNIKTSGGQNQTLLKIRRAESIGTYAWDSSEGYYDFNTSTGYGVNIGGGVNQWGDTDDYEGADLMRELNYDYLGKTEGAVGSQWYSGSNETKKDRPSSEYNLKSTAQEMIEEVEWNLGSPNNGPYIDFNDNKLIAPYVYSHERANTNGKKCTSYHIHCTDTVERVSKWTGKIGLLYSSDYLYATSGGSTTSREVCLNTNMSDWENYGDFPDCANNDWICTRYSQWTISPLTGSQFAQQVYFITGSGDISNQPTGNTNSVYPVVFLKSDISITGGDGSYSNPYKLSL